VRRGVDSDWSCVFQPAEAKQDQEWIFFIGTRPESTPAEVSVFQQAEAEQDQEWIFFIGTGSGAGVIFLAQWF